MPKPSQIDFDELNEYTEDELRLRYQRGGFNSNAEKSKALHALKQLEKARSYDKKCAEASRTAALDAKRYAKISIAISAISLILSLVSYL